ncbi:MAG: glutamate 5-kinase [Thermodesulfobacteriota bacterium]
MSYQLDKKQAALQRQQLFQSADRIVVKVGSAVLTNAHGINREVIANLAKGISRLRDLGKEVILVSSGAVAAGRKRLHLRDATAINLMEKQALAAIGQSQLMQHYDEAFSLHDKIIGQVLLTHSDFADRDRYLNVRNTILSLFRYNVVPIINENDTVSVEELRFGDNDTLGAMICNLIEADLFICLTDVEGLYTANPHTDPDARFVYTVEEVTEEIEAMAGNVKSLLGTGGMLSKIRAARMVAGGGGSSFIGPGKTESILERLFDGEMLGTFFMPSEEKIQSRKQWIAFVLRPKGFLKLDKGACTALCKGGKSLLPSGIVEVHGEFGTGDPVHCIDNGHVAVAAGLVNYSSRDLNIIKQCRSEQIFDLLGFKDCDEAIHRDNLVLLK